MAKIDWKKELKHLYLPKSKEFTIVDAPPMKFLMIDCHGDPNKSPEFQDMMGALYTMAYSLKFALKPEGTDFAVPPPEALWWMEGAAFDVQDKSSWDWTLMIMVPDIVTAELCERVRAEAQRKRACRCWPGCGWRRTTRDLRCRFCTSAPTPTRARPLRPCTSSSPSGAMC